jgi:hypothetical protein
MSAFLFFSQIWRPKFKSQNLSLKNTEISKLLGEKWKVSPAADSCASNCTLLISLHPMIQSYVACVLLFRLCPISKSTSSRSSTCPTSCLFLGGGGNIFCSYNGVEWNASKAQCFIFYLKYFVPITFLTCRCAKIMTDSDINLR